MKRRRQASRSSKLRYAKRYIRHEYDHEAINDVESGGKVIVDGSEEGTSEERKIEEKRLEARKKRRLEIQAKYASKNLNGEKEKKVCVDAIVPKMSPLSPLVRPKCRTVLPFWTCLGTLPNPREFSTASGAHPPARGERDDNDANWADREGYYKIMPGEVIKSKYTVLGTRGKGVFSTVMFASDGKRKVAIKCIRNNETMRRAAEKEVAILRAIAKADPSDKCNCVRLLDSFDHRSHVCMVFEAMKMNMREVVLKYGRKVGINISGVRAYSRQLFSALRLIKQLGIVHADLKPDNILVSEDLSRVKVCDFGSAFRSSDPDIEVTPYLVSRFYRAPEVILGLPYDFSIDTWSVATCLFEFFGGDFLFPGRTNNQMLLLQQDACGRFPNRMVRNHIAAFETLFEQEAHFEQDCRFRRCEVDPFTKRDILRVVTILDKPPRPIAGRVAEAASMEGAEERRLIPLFSDMLRKLLTLDPAKRMTVEDALKHPFCRV